MNTLVGGDLACASTGLLLCCVVSGANLLPSFCQRTQIPYPPSVDRKGHDDVEVSRGWPALHRDEYTCQGRHQDQGQENRDRHEAQQGDDRTRQLPRRFGAVAQRTR